jgi:hypothetical protein
MPSTWTLFLVALFIGTVLFSLAAFQCGVRFGSWRKEQPDPEPGLPVRTVVASILGLLSFILGFTFGLASSHYDSRSGAVFDEATAIGVAYRRADLLPEPERRNFRQLICEYVDLRLEAIDSTDRNETITRLRHLQERIWNEAVAIQKTDGAPPAATPLLQSLIDVIEVHSERVLDGMRSRIPIRVWLVLYGIALVSLFAAGYSFGLGGARRSIISVGYALVFASVIVMIAAGDHPGSDQLRMSHQALLELRSRLTAP